MSDQANQENTSGYDRKFRRKKGRNKLVLTIAVLLVLILAAGALLGLSSSDADEIPRGVEAGGIDLGGESVDEAKSTLEERAYALNEVRVKGDGEEITIPASSLGVSPDVEATIENAQSVGRKGNVFERAGEKANGLFGTVEVPLEVAYNEDSVRSKTGSIARQLNVKPTQAGVSVTAGGAEVSESAKGYEIDVQQTSSNIQDSIKSLEGQAELVGGPTKPEITTPDAEKAAETARKAVRGPAVLTAEGEEWRLTSEQLATAVSVEPAGDELQVQVDGQSLRSNLSGMYSSINTNVKEASYGFDGNAVTVSEGRIGKGIRTQKLLNSLKSGLPEGQRQYEVPIIKNEPDLTTKQAQEQRPTQMIGNYRTTFQKPGADEPARVENLRISGQALTGQTVAPGKIFSANEVLAPLDYNKTSVFINGAEEKADGGGLCQVASTLYMAVNYAGLQPVERHPHSALLNYIRPGLDATIWFGAENGGTGQALDMKFKNTSDGYVFIREYVQGGYIYAEIWGQPTGREVTMDSNNLFENSQSSKWTTTKTVNNAQGETTFDGALHTDTYYELLTDEGKVSPDQVEVAPVNP